MNITKWLTVVLLLAFLTGAGPVWVEAAQGKKPARFLQGFVTSYDGDRMIVNETWRIRLTGKTRVLTVDGEERARLHLEGQKWVYVEGVERRDGTIEAVKIYLLPKYIEKDERDMYPFMKLP